MYSFIKRRQKEVFLTTAVVSAVLYYANLVHENLFAYDDSGQSKIVSHHLAGLETTQRLVRGLVLGGSNAMYGISAKQLSQQTHIEFYNLSLLSQGYNLENYNTFLGEAAKTLDASEIGVVIWSPIQIYFARDTQDYSKDLFGKSRKIGVFPSHSVLRNLVQAFRENFSDGSVNEHVVEGDFGDFDFLNFKCEFDFKQAKHFPYQSYKKYLESIAVITRRNFPNARTLIVSPSLYHQPILTEEFREEVRVAAGSWDMIIAFQSGVRDPDYICDAAHHTNSVGRRWRTDELSKIVLQSLQQ